MEITVPPTPLGCEQEPTKREEHVTVSAITEPKFAFVSVYIHLLIQVLDTDGQ